MGFGVAVAAMFGAVVIFLLKMEAGVKMTEPAGLSSTVVGNPKAVTRDSEASGEASLAAVKRVAEKSGELMNDCIGLSLRQVTQP